MNDTRIFINKIDHIMKIIVPLMSLVVIGAIVVDYGFVLDELEMLFIHKVYSLGWWVFVLSFTFQLFLHWDQIRKKTFSLTMILGIVLYMSALPKIFHTPEYNKWLTYLWNFLENKYFIIASLGLFSVIELSRSITGFVNKKTNPALLVVICFAVTIVFGALLLLLPRSTMEHIRLPVIDALFVSTSAVCVTGLSTVDVGQTFTLEGQIIIAMLIQIGGLGIMTITTFFAIFFMNGVGFYSQFTLKDMLSSSAESLISTLLHVLGFTIVIELIGAFFIWISVHPMTEMTLNQEIFFSVFHSISAFCNAGFSTLENNLGNQELITGHNFFYIVISILIILGGVGFPILINLKKQFSYYLSVLHHRLFNNDRLYTRYTHLANLNTKIVLYVTLVLIVSGTFFIALFEWNNSFAGLSVSEKITHAFFNAVVPRTAGFNSISTGEFTRLTIILTMILMWIGGASQSTAGGVKVNTIAVAFASIKSLIRGQQTTELFNREIPYNTIRRTLVVIMGSILTILFFFIMIAVLEPDMSSRSILFETISAFSTVGSSLGITQDFSNMSKFLLVILMFIGRVGFITILMSIVPQSGQTRYRLPEENIIIN